MICIFLNIVAMGIVYKGISGGLSDIISIINNIFLGIFHVEAIIKIIALKNYYLKDSWNKFDFAIIIQYLLSF